MRPANIFLIMQLSNSRACHSHRGQQHQFLQYFKKYVLTEPKPWNKIPSLTVEKKNECHNP